MADKNKTASVGKTYKGQTFVPERTVESVQEGMEAQKVYDKEGAVSMDVYFVTQGITSLVHQAGMRAFTAIKRATVEDWAEIFKRF